MNVRIILSALWVALMLNNLLGDVLRIFTGDFKAGEMGGQTATQWMWFTAALLMLIPIVMVVLTLMLPYPAIRWVCIAAAAFLFIFNAVSVHTYPGHYDKFLIIVAFAFNILTVWLAATWRTPV